MNSSQHFEWHWKLMLLGPIAFILSHIAAQFPTIIEKFYSNGFQKLIRQGLSLITGIFPFSLTEIVFVLFIIFCLISLILMIIRVIRKQIKPILLAKKLARNILLFICLVYFFTTTIHGLGYHREPFSISAGLKVQEYEMDELVLTAEVLIRKVNELRYSVSERIEGFFSLSGTRKENFVKAHKGLEELSTTYPQFKGRYGLPKRASITKLFMSLNIWGLYSFLGETLISDAVPDLYYPYVVSHELAHQRGIGNEGDANYVGYLACINHADVNFQYAGYFIALEYVMDEIYLLDKEEYEFLLAKMDWRVKRDWEFAWSQLTQQNVPKLKILSRMNDIYMKSLGISDGMKSYNQFVDMLVAEYVGE